MGLGQGEQQMNHTSQPVVPSLRSTRAKTTRSVAGRDQSENWEDDPVTRALWTLGCLLVEGRAGGLVNLLATNKWSKVLKITRAWLKADCKVLGLDSILQSRGKDFEGWFNRVWCSFYDEHDRAHPCLARRHPYCRATWWGVVQKCHKLLSYSAITEADLEVCGVL